jgi:O-antigen/teichoic acid export membrane protein
MDVATGTLVMLFYRLSGSFCWALAGIITARALSVEERGAYVAAVVIVAAVGHVAGRFTSSSGYFITNRKQPPEEVAANELVLALAGGLVLLAGALAVAATASGDDRLLIVLVGLGLAPAMTKSVMGGVFLAQNKLGRNQLAAQGHAWVGVVLLAGWVVILGHRSATNALGAWIAGQYIALVLVLFAGRGWWGWMRQHGLDPVLMRRLLAFGAVVGTVGIVSILNLRTSQLLVAALDGREGVGIYASAVAASEALWLAAGAVAAASYSRVGGLARDESARLTARAVRHSVLIAAGIGAVLFVLAPVLIEFVYGSRYTGATESARVLAVGAVVFAARPLLWNYFTVQLGKPRIVLVLEVLSAVVGVGLSVVLIPQMGYVGAAWGTAVAYLLTMGVATRIFARTSGLPGSELWRLRSDDIRSYWRLGQRLARRGGRTPVALPASAGEEL